MRTIQLYACMLLLTGMVAGGCSSMNRTQKGAVIGTAGGAAVGAVIGKAAGNTAMGAIIGAAVGGTAGAVIGHKMDKQAEEMEKVLGDAEVRRVGEGIVINFKDKVLFGFDRSDLTSSAETNMNKLIGVLQKYPDTNIEIIGHTDSKGTEEYNLNLSQRRSSSVAAYLRNHSVASGRITTKGMGESDPVASNDTEEGQSQNRRVEFVITANQKMIDEAKKGANP
jgi:outer membrane protein OmpA-like peptidoglycan-associated protein